MTNQIMKMLSFLLFCFWAVTSLGQDISRGETPPGIRIGKYKWQQVNAGPSVDPSLKAESDSASGDSSSASTQDSRFAERPSFVYSMEIRNDGPKPIKAIRWDYIITDSKTNQELGRHEFETFEKVGITKVKGLRARSRQFPTRVVQIPQSAKTTDVERVELRCILYEDGTLWRQAGATPGLCEAFYKRATN